MKNKIKIELIKNAPIDRLYSNIRTIMEQARNNIYQAVNVAMVQTYWQIGRAIVEEEQKGQLRAEYGKKILSELSSRLTMDYGKGFDESNLRYIRAFYVAFPKCDALRHELSWTHYRLLLRVEKAQARDFYIMEAIHNRWSTRELERQIDSLLFERFG